VGGQGMNTGIQDAYNLAWKLDLVIRGRARPSLLDSYELERRPIAREVVFGTDRATRAALLKPGVLLAARNKIAQLLTSLGAVERKLARTASQLDLHYRGSPIVAEDRTLEAWVRFAGGPRPGERAPDSLLAHGARLHAELRGTAHVLLTFGDDQGLEAVADVATARAGADLRVLHLGKARDPEGDVRRRYGASPGSLVLIRPDKYVGYRAEPADETRLDAYLATIFV
jgi:FAD binding domain/Aromatic-ring hydroxylase, C-terminal